MYIPFSAFDVATGARAIYVEDIDRLIVCPERAAVLPSVQHTLAPFPQVITY